MDDWTAPPPPPPPLDESWSEPIKEGGFGDWCTCRPEKLVMALAAFAGVAATLVAVWVLA